MLNMYTHCLKQMNHHEEYVRVGLKIVAKLLLENRTTSSFRGALEKKAASLAELISASTVILRQVTVPMQDYFGNIKVDPHVRPYEDHDGFCLQLQVTNFTSDTIKVQMVRIKLITIDEDHHSELWLTADKDILIQPGIVAISVGTKVCKILLSSRPFTHGARL